MPPVELLVPVLAITALAGLVQGLAGFGAALVAVPLLALVLPVGQVVPLMVLLGVLITLLNLLHLRRALRLRPVVRLLAGYLIGIPLGLVFLIHAPRELALGTLGLAIAVYALVSLAGYRPRAQWLRERQLAIGILSGALGGAFSTNGPPVILHVTAHHEWDADRQKATLSLYFFLASLITLAAFAATDLITPEVLRWWLWGTPTLVLGTLGGMVLYRRLGDHGYKRITFLLILVTGVVLVVRALDSILSG